MTVPDAPTWLLAVDLDGGARPQEWTRAVTALERAGVDLITFPDALAPRRTDDPRAQLGRDEVDTVQLAAFLATQTTTIGLLPTVNLTETEPFHISTAAATLDYASKGRAGLLVRVGTPAEARNVGLRAPDENANEGTGLWREAADAITVIRALWDSWEDDAIIRDSSTGRFVDRDRLHYIDFVGETFSVKGPAIIPRPPQGQLPIAVDVTDLDGARWAALHADIAFLPNPAYAELWAAIRENRASQLPAVRTLVDVHLDDSFESDVDPGEDAVNAWVTSALAPLSEGADGIRLRPHGGIAAADLLIDILIPRLRAAANTAGNQPVTHDRNATAPPATTLRGRVGLSRPASRYAPASKETSK